MTNKEFPPLGSQDIPPQPGTRGSDIEPMTGESLATSPFTHETIQTVRTAQDPVIHPPDATILTRVRKGMIVLDATGKEIGKVAEVKQSDPEAASDFGEEVPPALNGLLGTVAQSLEHPRAEAPEGELHDRLVHEGYLLLDTKGIFRRNRYIESDQIAGVSGDAVTLLVDFDHLTEA